MRDDHGKPTGRNPTRLCVGGNQRGRKTFSREEATHTQVRVLGAALGRDVPLGDSRRRGQGKCLPLSEGDVDQPKAKHYERE